MDFKQEYFINTATDDKRDGDYNLYSRLVKLFHIAPPDTESTGCFRKNYSQTQEIKIPTIERSWFLRYHLQGLIQDFTSGILLEKSNNLEKS